MHYLVRQTPTEILLLKIADIGQGKINPQLKGFSLQSGAIESWEKDFHFEKACLKLRSGQSIFKTT